MWKRTVSRIMLTLFLVGMLTLALDIQPVKSDWTWTETIYIRADGSIDPSTAPISTVDNITYTLTDNIVVDFFEDLIAIVVERNNIVVDGAGYILQGSHWGSGINLSGRKNVTIKNIEIRQFIFGIYISNSSDISICNNSITLSEAIGLIVQSSSKNNVTTNNIKYNYIGIRLEGTDNNCISGNQIVANGPGGGMFLLSSTNNSMFRNNVTKNWIGIGLSSSSNNRVFHNNLINNTHQLFSSNSVNIWDDSCPSGGNYWSDYTGVDADGDGIGDMPYVIDENNTDRYPLMHPWSSLPVHNINTGLGYGTIQEAINANETLNGHTIFVETGTYYENVVVNKTVSLVGENNDYTIIDAGGGIATSVHHISNVVVTNFALRNGWSGVSVYRSNQTEISNNVIFNHKQDGIRIDQSERNTISGNVIFNISFTGAPQGGILLYLANNNTVFDNKVYSCQYPGICICSSSNNTISGNTIETNHAGVYVYMGSIGNIFAHNNFVSNTVQVWTDSINIWDNGCEGNYWSNYNGTDSDGDGIGDTPYIIDENNQDNYPLMHPYGSVHNLDTNLTYLTIQSAINAPDTLNGHTIFVETGTYCENVVVNKTVSLVGEDRENTIIDGSGRGNVVNVTANRVIISGFTIQNGGYGKNGITLFYCKNCTISSNTMVRAQQLGISLKYSNNNTIAGNTVANNAYGVYLDNSGHNIVRNNTIGSNGALGLTLSDSNNNVISGNIINSNGMDGISLYYSSFNSILGNIVLNNSYGIDLAYSGDNTIYHNNVIDNTHQVWLPYVHLSNVWDDGYPSGGNYWSDYTGTDLCRGSYQNETRSDGIGDTPYIIDENNTDRYPLMKPYAGPHDIGLTNIATSKTVVGQGYSLHINIMIFNYGNNTENFNVTAYANTTIIDVFENVTLTSRNSTTITILWNTTDWAKGNYTISANATAVPGEIDTTDNNSTDGWVFVTIQGDVDGDRDVDIYDVVKITGIYGSKRGDPQFNPNSDLDDDGEIKIYDVVRCTSHYGQSW